MPTSARPKPELESMGRGNGEIFRLPSSSSSHVRRTGPPCSTPARSRQRFGTVIWPCEVTVAVSIFIVQLMKHYPALAVKSGRAGPPAARPLQLYADDHQDIMIWNHALWDGCLGRLLNMLQLCERYILPAPLLFL
jgi:hypothetical protein